MIYNDTLYLRTPFIRTPCLQMRNLKYIAPDSLIQTFINPDDLHWNAIVWINGASLNNIFPKDENVHLKRNLSQECHEPCQMSNAGTCWRGKRRYEVTVVLNDLISNHGACRWYLPVDDICSCDVLKELQFQPDFDASCVAVNWINRISSNGIDLIS